MEGKVYPLLDVRTCRNLVGGGLVLTMAGEPGASLWVFDIVRAFCKCPIEQGLDIYVRLPRELGGGVANVSACPVETGVERVVQRDQVVSPMALPPVMIMQDDSLNSGARRRAIDALE